MTNLEKIISKVKHPLLEENDFVSALEDRGLISTEEYSSGNLKLIELTS